MTDNPLNVLLIEEGANHIEPVRRAFESNEVNAVLTSADTMKEAYSILEKMTPDIVIADYLLPDGKGTDLLTDEKLNTRFPLIILSSHDDEEIAAGTLKTGTIHYVMKSTAVLSDMPSIVRLALSEWKSEQNLSESEARYRQLVQHAPASIYEVDLARDRFVIVNDVICEYSGYSREELLNMSPSQLLDEKGKKILEERYQRIKEGKTISDTIEYELVRKDGTKIWTLMNTSLVYENDHGVRARVVAYDISNRMETELALKESEEKYRNLVERAGYGIIIIIDGIVEFANEHMSRMVGYDVQEIIGSHFADFVHPDETDRLKELYRLRLEGKEVPVIYSSMIVCKDGSTMYVEVNAGLISYRGAEADLVTIRDITQRKRSEKLQEAVFSISQAVDRTESIDELYEVVHYHIQQVMPAENFYIALYDEKDDLLNFPYFVDEVDSPPPPQKTRKGLTEYVLRNGESMLCTMNDFKALAKKGEVELRGGHSEIWLGVPLKVEKKTIGVMGVQHYTDPGVYTLREQQMLEFVSIQVALAIERKQAEEALRTSEELIRGIVTHVPVGVLYLDDDGTMLYANPSLYRMIELTEDESDAIVGRKIQSIQRIMNAGGDVLLTQLLNGEVISGIEFEFITRSGTDKLFEIHAAPRFDSIGKIIGAVLLCEDVTGFKQMEAQLQRAHRMEAVGRLAGGIAHDFNNLLTAITGNAELARFSLESENPAWQKLEEITRTADRAAKLVQQLLAFSRKQIISPKVIELNSILNEMETMLRRIIGEDIELITRYEDELWRIKADPAQIEQVIVNFAINARDAMPNGGKLVVETSNSVLDQSYALSHPEVEPGDYVAISVSDDGEGMSEEIQANIFEPFFTTKDEGKGTGLGLATVYGIVKQSHGEITVNSEIGNGTTFKVHLPRNEEEKVETSAPEQPLTDPGGTETILVVEDEEPVRELAVLSLQHYGYNVLKAADGNEALQLSKSLNEPVDLVLTDIVMPQMNGFELIDRIREIWPKVKVLYMSGYSDDVINQQTWPDFKSIYIQKPFRPVTLAGRIKELLSSDLSE